MMLLCSVAFVLLNKLPLAKRLHLKLTLNNDERTYESVELESKSHDQETGLSKQELIIQPNMLSKSSYIYFLIIIFLINGLSNGVLPSLSTYSSLPYGETPYHLSQALGNMANPLACIVALFLPLSSAFGIGMFFLASLGKT